MNRKHTRKNFLRANKYQKRVIIIPFLSALILCTLLTIIVIIIQNDFLKAILVSKNIHAVEFINKWAILFVLYLWTFFIIVIMGALTISNNLVGAFVRIIKELDLILEGKKTTNIYVRRDDDLAQELLKRINILINKSKT